MGSDSNRAHFIDTVFVIPRSGIPKFGNLLWRHQNAIGYGISLRDFDSKKGEIPTWNMKLLDPNKNGRFNIFYGPGEIRDAGDVPENRINNGDIYKYWKDFTKFVREKTGGPGLDLVVADGGFEVDETSMESKEKQSFHLVLCEFLTAISILKEGGDFTCKMFHCLTERTAQLIYLCSLCFENISLVKPVPSRMNNSEKYIVCKSRKSDAEVEPVLKLLERAANAFNVSDPKMLDERGVLISSPSSLLKGGKSPKGQKVEMTVDLILEEGSLPMDFADWLTEMNNEFLDIHLLAMESVLQFIADPNSAKDEGHKYNLSKAFSVWQVPGNFSS